MIKLSSGNYLGKAEKVFNAGGIIVSITSYPDTNYSERLHCHETLHMSFVLTGGNLEKRYKRDIERMPGVTTIYDAGEIHQSTNTLPSSKNFNIEIENAFLQQYDLERELTKSSVKEPGAGFLMLKILREWEVDNLCSNTSIHALMLNFFQEIKQQGKIGSIPTWLNNIRELLNDRWDENISLNELARTVNVHPVTVSKYFPKYFGCTIGEYTRQLKIKRAIALIQTSSYSLTQIATACGFADQSHFIRAFKQQAAFLPKKFQTLIKS